MNRRQLVYLVTSVLIGAVITFSLVLYFRHVVSSGAEGCGGRWFPFEMPTLLWFAGAPAVLGALFLGPNGLFAHDSARTKVIVRIFVAALFLAFSLGVPWVTVAGVCVRDDGVSAHRLAGILSMGGAEVLAARSSRQGEDRIVVLVGRNREVAVPVARGMGLGRAADPEGLAVALRDFGERAGLTEDDSVQQEMQRQRDTIKALAPPPP